MANLEHGATARTDKPLHMMAGDYPHGDFHLVTGTKKNKESNCTWNYERRSESHLPTNYRVTELPTKGDYRKLNQTNRESSSSMKVLSMMRDANPNAQ